MKIEEYLSAMKKRCSRRKYIDRPVEPKYVQLRRDLSRGVSTKNTHLYLLLLYLRAHSG